MASKYLNYGAGRRVGARVEVLEGRQLLTAVVIQPSVVLRPDASGNVVVDGYSPKQIRDAYGFNSQGGDGSGQTIAIIGAYNDPKILSDLQVFDRKFGIYDPPSLKVVNQSGGSASGLQTDAGWAGELSLDVEWAHAIAPKANIMVVEANSDSLSSLMTAVNYARHAAGVSVVSMSWGAGEFWGQTSYDAYFTTPAGHQGVTFVAASGDSGSWWGPSWPSSSANVLAVGGTSLSLSGSNAYAGESGWQDSGGGISSYVSEPSYQSKAQTTGGRTNPDVGYNADPNTGFAVYDSIAYQGYSGWQVVGGTSAGAPQWAGTCGDCESGTHGQGRWHIGRGDRDVAGACMGCTTIPRRTQPIFMM